MNTPIRDIAVGYQGWLKITHNFMSRYIPVISGNLVKTDNIMVDDSLVGDESYTSVGDVFVSPGVLKYEGTISCYIYKDTWELLSLFLLNDRTIESTIVISTDGIRHNTFIGCKVSSVTFTGNESNDNVRVDISVVAKNSHESVDTDSPEDGWAEQFQVSGSIVDEELPHIDTLPLPWWQTFIYKEFPHSDWVPGNVPWLVGNSADVLSWEVTINHNISTMYSYNKINEDKTFVDIDIDSRNPRIIKQGKLDINGKMVLYSIGGINEPNDSQKMGRVVIQFGGFTKTTVIEQRMGDNGENEEGEEENVEEQQEITEGMLMFGRIFIPKVYIVTYPYPMVDKNTKVSRTISFVGVGTYKDNIGYPPVLLQYMEDDNLTPNWGNETT